MVAKTVGRRDPTLENASQARQATRQSLKRSSRTETEDEVVARPDKRAKQTRGRA